MVQAETVTFFSRGKAVGEDPLKVGLADATACVLNDDHHGAGLGLGDVK